jgi:methylthioribose-1-phosphate isomerase
MRVNGQPYRTIWPNADHRSVSVIDQTLLPHVFKVVEWQTLEDVVAGIRNMVVRGAPLIGASAGYGIALAMAADPSDKAFEHAYGALYASRPTAVNLRWALDRMRSVLLSLEPRERLSVALATAKTISDEDVANSVNMGKL